MSQGQAAGRFKTLIEETSRLRRAVGTEGGLTPGQVLVATWQCQRLAATYADYHLHKRYRQALDFFLSDIYGPRDFSQRDNDIGRVYPIMVKMLSEAAIESLTNAMELHALSMNLDQKLLEVLERRFGFAGTSDIGQLTPARYAEAYRLCDNYADRVRQIDLAVEAASILDRAVKKKMLYVTVKVARKPAQLAGFGELQSFIERGLAAFKRMKGADEFLNALRTRETCILERIYAAAPTDQWYGEATHKLATLT